MRNYIDEEKLINRVTTDKNYCKVSTSVHCSLDRDFTKTEENIINCFLTELHAQIQIENYKQSKDYPVDLASNECLLELFSDEKIYIQEISNEYWSSVNLNAIGRPWYLVTTKLGTFKIGWRKRVILIDWITTDITQTADEIFPDEDVTKDEYTIHAWGLEKAQQYINTLLSWQ